MEKGAIMMGVNTTKVLFLLCKEPSESIKRVHDSVLQFVLVESVIIVVFGVVIQSGSA